MQFRLAKEQDWLQLAEMKWLHCEEDEADYGEGKYALSSISKAAFFSEYLAFMQTHRDYRVYVACEGEMILSAMFVYLIPKTPKPNREQKYIAYLTNVYTRKEYRNQGIGAQLMQEIKEDLAKMHCELMFAWPSEKSISWYSRNGFAADPELMVIYLEKE